VLADPPAGPGDLGSPSRPRNTAWAVLPLRQQPIPLPSPIPSTAKDWRGARSKQRSAAPGRDRPTVGQGPPPAIHRGGHEWPESALSALPTLALALSVLC